MAKGQRSSNRELKKPKAAKKPAPPPLVAIRLPAEEKSGVRVRFAVTCVRL